MILKQFSNVNSIGLIILNSELEIISTNKYIKDVFEENDVEVDKYLEHILGCEDIKHDSSKLGEKRNIHINSKYVIHEKKQIKWFDLSIASVDIHDNRYFFLFLKDLTEFMHFKVEYEMSRMLDGEESMIKKEEFHDEVMHCIKTKYYKGKTAYLILIELANIQIIQEFFGVLWRNDYATSFYQFMSAQMDILDLACKYSNNQIMVFLPCKNDEEYMNFLDSMEMYQYKWFQMKDNVFFKTIKFIMDSNKIKELVDSDHLYLEYFKAISQLEHIENGTVYEFCF
jgi:GGDEF domain-containing protein